MVKVADMIGYVDIGESKNWIIYDNLKIDIELHTLYRFPISHTVGNVR